VAGADVSARIRRLSRSRALLRQDRRSGVVQRGRAHLGYSGSICRARVAYFVPPANQNTVPTCGNAETREGGEFGTETATSKCRRSA
jgi:hypothetical protein